MQQRTEVIEAGEDPSSPSLPFRESRLHAYFAERGIQFSAALVDEDSDPGWVLTGIEYQDSPGWVTLIIPAHLRHGSASELLRARPTFAALATDGELYCIEDAAAGVEPCPAPDLPGE